ncbi:MAG: YidC/Oxa1 family membrane protein insertase [bacterium]|nr:YidC/Oxa1 family membrane protein insertase [bacterium]
MIGSLFNTLLYQPFYNGLVFLISVIPGGDVGVAVIVLTIAVKLGLFSLSYRSIISQQRLKELGPELERIKTQFKNDKQRQAMETMALYRREGVNPLSTILSLLLQIPVVLALYFVFVKAGLPAINHELLYDFLAEPGVISLSLLGLIDISKKSVILAVLAGATQYLQARLMTPQAPQGEPRDGERSLKDELARSLQLQMKYVFPALIGFFAYNFGGAVALYFAASNAFAIGQEMYVKRARERESGK